MNKKKKLTILTCCFNEQDNILNLYKRVKKSLDRMIDWELIYADNNSTDGSEKIYRKLAAKDKRVKIIFMSRNDGTGQHSLLAGLHIARGDALVYLDGDLQDPPEIIPAFIEQWKNGWDVVYGIRVKRKEGLFRRIGYYFFYRIFRKMSYISIPVDAGDFSLIDRKVINALKSFKEQDLFFRGARAVAGFRQTGVKYERDKRTAGKTSNSFFNLFTWASRAIFNFSKRPLEWISQIAGLVTIATVAYLGYFLYVTIFHRDAPHGIPTIIVLVLFLGSIQLLSLSIIGNYLGRIFIEAKHRPRAIIKEIINDKDHKDLIIS